MSRPVCTLLLLPLCVLLVSCGGHRSVLTVQVREKEWQITLASTTLRAGQIIFDVKNVGTIPHNLAITGTNDRTKLIPPGQTVTLTAQLKPGRYELYCSRPRHKEAGMDVKIQVSLPKRTRSSSSAADPT